MDIQELIKKYRIILWDNDKICIQNDYMFKKDKAEELIKSKKAEIVAYLKEKKAEKSRAFELRQEKIKSIEGLEEIQDAIEKQVIWRRKFNQAMDSEDGILPTKPEDNIAELKQKYPRAAAYLKAESESLKRNHELSEIGKDALERIINGEDYIKVLSDMDKRQHEFCQKHFWD